MVQRPRRRCDYSLRRVPRRPSARSAGLFVSLLPFYRRHGARWKLAGAQLHVFSLTPENDPPAGFFIPGRWPSIVAMYPSGDVASSVSLSSGPALGSAPNID